MQGGKMFIEIPIRPFTKGQFPLKKDMYIFFRKED